MKDGACSCRGMTAAASFVAVFLAGVLYVCWIYIVVLPRSGSQHVASIPPKNTTLFGLHPKRPTSNPIIPPPPLLPQIPTDSLRALPSLDTLHVPSTPPPLPNFTCPPSHSAPTCPTSHPTLLLDPFPSPSSCPSYFRWIHEDLKPWKSTGITRDMVDRARRTATFRLTIIEGRLYVEQFRRAFQSRDVFTIWGVLQLLRRYPGRVPDVELMFDCVDWPVVKATRYGRRRRKKGGERRGEVLEVPPAVFRYCGDDETLDVVFPDWSFWGWPEINIKPWEQLLEELKEGNSRIKWMSRYPYAYWKGNPAVATTRMDLLKCNVSDIQDWNARVFAQDWASETRQGFKESNLVSQCNYRYKIYIEGSAWSVSEKYILACDSLTLLVMPRYYDFFTRGLIPLKHYWPIRPDKKCSSIRFAVDWGNRHNQKAHAIGKEASTFIAEKLTMDYVYDYMFHLLNEYSKLMKFKPSIPAKAVEICLESMACRATGLRKKFMMESMVNVSRSSSPCSLPPPFDSHELRRLLKEKDKTMKQVQSWELEAKEDDKNGT